VGLPRCRTWRVRDRKSAIFTPLCELRLVCQCVHICFSIYVYMYMYTYTYMSVISNVTSKLSFFSDYKNPRGQKLSIRWCLFCLVEMNRHYAAHFLELGTWSRLHLLQSHNTRELQFPKQSDRTFDRKGSGLLPSLRFFFSIWLSAFVWNNVQVRDWKPLVFTALCKLNLVSTCVQIYLYTHVCMYTYAHICMHNL